MQRDLTANHGKRNTYLLLTLQDNHEFCSLPCLACYQWTYADYSAQTSAGYLKAPVECVYSMAAREAPGV